MRSDVMNQITAPQDMLRKGDYVPEIYFIGQVVGGSDYNVAQDGLFVEAYLNYGEDWTHIEDDTISGPI